MTTDRGLTLRDAVARGADFLKRKGITSARLDAELLVGAATGMDRLQIYMNMDKPLTPGETEAARKLVMRRGTREPVAYILGHKEFRSRDFRVGPGVLVPRPETELLVEYAKEELALRFPGVTGGFRILELGIGSGVIGISTALELPGTCVTATEILPAAAEIARENVARHGVADRVHVLEQADLRGIEGRFHALLSNPPYIREGDAGMLEPEIANFEPREALFSGEDGAGVIRTIVAQAPPVLEANGFVMLEIGAGMASLVREICGESGLCFERTLLDYAGIERFVLLSKRSGVQ